MSKHITQIADRYTADIIAGFETEEWHTPHIVTFFAVSRPYPVVIISKWVADDYVTLEPAPIKPDDKLLTMLHGLPEFEREFGERFCILDDGMIYETLEEWRASWNGDEPHPLEWHDVFAGER